MTLKRVGDGNWSSWGISKKVRQILEKIQAENKLFNQDEVIIYILVKAGYDVAEFQTADKLLTEEEIEKL